MEDTTVQVTWPALHAGPVRVTAFDGGRPVAQVEVAEPPRRAAGRGGPVAAVVDGLVPDRELRIEVTAGGSSISLATRTLPPPPGPLLARFATMSDLHLGERSFGLLGAISEDPLPVVPVSVRAAHAAGRELRAWGAELLVIKGDLTHRGQPSEWAALGGLLDDVGIPALICPGNHEHAGHAGMVDPHDALQHLGHAGALELVQHRDLPGVRVVLADTTLPRSNRGHVAHVADQVVQLAAEADGGAWVGLHHQIDAHAVPVFWPPGIPLREGLALLAALGRAQPRSFVSSGHTHRHRRRTVGSVVVTEVGSPKDHPGVWAGYAIHEGGIRQVVRRVEAPDVLAWTERTAAAALGAWGRWSPGRLEDRSFSHPWPQAVAG